MDKLLEELDAIELPSDEELENADFAELALYLQELNTIDSATKQILENGDKENE